MFCDRTAVEKPQRSPLSTFSALWDFRAPVGPFFWVCSFFEFFLENFFIFEYCKREYLTLGSLLAIFEPWIWRRLGPVPACLTSIVAKHQQILGGHLQIIVKIPYDLWGRNDTMITMQKVTFKKSSKSHRIQITLFVSQAVSTSTWCCDKVIWKIANRKTEDPLLLGWIYTRVNPKKPNIEWKKWSDLFAVAMSAKYSTSFTEVLRT